MPQIVTGYRHLTPEDLRPPTSPGVFFDPADTETGIWATVDLLEPGCVVLDLGSGSGAAAAAVARAGAGSVHGVDVSEESVRWATERYAGRNGSRGAVDFAVADYVALSSAKLLDVFALTEPPAVVASNPPYVPIPSVAGLRVSVDGGPDGLRLVRVVIARAAELGAELALTIGTYSSPRLAASLLRSAGYEIHGLTLTALRLGDYTARHVERVAELEAAGEGPLLRTADGSVQYVVVGLSCRRGAGPGLEPDALLDVLRLACTSKTVELEALHGPTAGGSVPIRILVLPDEPLRLHV